MRTCPVCKKEKRHHKDGLQACSRKCETRKLTREAIHNAMGGYNDPLDVHRTVRRSHVLSSFQGR